MICEQNPNLYLVKYFLSLNAGTHVGPPVDTRVPVGGLLLALHQKAAGEHQADDLNPKEHESERLHVFHPRLYFGPQLRLARAGERARQGHPVDHFVEPAAFQLLLDISPRLYISCVPPVAQVFFRFFDSKNKQTEHNKNTKRAVKKDVSFQTIIHRILIPTSIKNLSEIDGKTTRREGK